jgi:hypothetical protein
MEAVASPTSAASVRGRANKRRDLWLRRMKGRIEAGKLRMQLRDHLDRRRCSAGPAPCIWCRSILTCIND